MWRRGRVKGHLRYMCYYYSLSGNDDDQVVGVEKTGERYVSCVYRYICIYHVHICGIIYHL